MVQMARDKLMPRASAEPLHYPASKAIFPELFKELADDVRLWLDAELALAKAEAGLRLRGYATGLIVAFLGVSAIHRCDGGIGTSLRQRLGALRQQPKLLPALLWALACLPLSWFLGSSRGTCSFAKLRLPA